MGKRKSVQRQFEVEKIIGVKIEDGEEVFEVKWIDYEETTWEPLENLKACPEALKEFYSAEKKKKKNEEEARKTPAKTPKISRRRIRKDSEENSLTSPTTRAGFRENESEAASSLSGSSNGSIANPRVSLDHSSSSEINPQSKSRAPPPSLVSKETPPPLIQKDSRLSQQRAEDVEGLRSHWEPQSILTCYEAPDDMYYVVKWKNIGNPSIVSSTNLRQTHPDLLITYLQEKLNCAMQRGTGISP